MTGIIMWSRRSVFTLVLGVLFIPPFIIPSRVQADPLPPWIKSYQYIPLGTASAQECQMHRFNMALGINGHRSYLQWNIP